MLLNLYQFDMVAKGLHSFATEGKSLKVFAPDLATAEEWLEKERKSQMRRECEFKDEEEKVWKHTTFKLLDVKLYQTGWPHIGYKPNDPRETPSVWFSGVFDLCLRK